MDSYTLIKQLIFLVDDFRKDHPNDMVDIKSFLQWLDTKENQRVDENDYVITGHSLEVEIAAYIGRLSRYSNTYIKKVLENLPFSTDMEFAFTAILDGAGQVGKTDLIRMMAYDKSSGMGVIKRLLKNGIIEEFPNPKDRRGKLLRLTTKGKKNVGLAYEKAPKAADLISKKLDTQEKSSLLRLLRKLDEFHYPIYLNDKLATDLLS